MTLLLRANAHSLAVGLAPLTTPHVPGLTPTLIGLRVAEQSPPHPTKRGNSFEALGVKPVVFRTSLFG